MNNILTLVLIVLLIILICCGFDKKEQFKSKLNNKIAFELKKIPNLNLVYIENNFYFTNDNQYIFIGILDKTNGLFQLQDGIKNYNFILNFKVNDALDSHITLESSNQDNPNSFSISNVFNQKNKNIYLDPINKVLVSNDNFGNNIYLTYFIYGSPVYWNYNIDNAVKFEINYL
jgi:hypothetical protein